MNKEDIVRVAQESGFSVGVTDPVIYAAHERFFHAAYAAGVAAERERLAQPEPPPECKTEEEKTAFAFGWLKAMEAQRVAQQEQDQKPPVKTYCGGKPNYCTPEQEPVSLADGRMTQYPDGSIGVGTPQEPVIQWDASAPLVMQLPSAFQQPEPRITFHPGDPMKEVMRIDRHGVKVNPEFTVDEATQHVLNALTAHIQHTINHAVAVEREACAQLLDEMAARDKLSNYYAVAAKAIRARGQQ